MNSSLKKTASADASHRAYPDVEETVPLSHLKRQLVQWMDVEDFMGLPDADGVYYPSPVGIHETGRGVKRKKKPASSSDEEEGESDGSDMKNMYPRL